MVKNNGIPFEVKKPFETVQELKDKYETPSFEEFMKTYEADDKIIDSYKNEVDYVNVWAPKGSGPCKKDGCSCSCKWDSSSCRWCVEKIYSEEGCDRYGVLRNSGEVKVRLLKDGKFKGHLSASTVEWDNGSDSGKLFGASAESSASWNEEDGVQLKGSLGLDLYDYKDKDKHIRIRPNVDTGVKISSDGVEFKALGFGFSADDEQIGISTPLGEAKCVVQ